MKEIKILKDNNNINLQKKAEMYMNIFGEEPWNEGFICEDCEKLYSLSQVKKNEIKECLECQGNINPFYNIEDLKEKWENWSKKEGYVGMLAETLNNELVGFIMGWGSNIQNLNELKLDLSEDELKVLKENISKIDVNFNYDNLFYAADIGVKKDFRSNSKKDLHLASKLYNAREKGIIEKGFKNILVRTTKKSDVPYKRYKSKGFKDVFDYNDQQDRVILIKNL